MCGGGQREAARDSLRFLFIILHSSVQISDVEKNVEIKVRRIRAPLNPAPGFLPTLLKVELNETN